jgi:hypothetical protein
MSITASMARTGLSGRHNPPKLAGSRLWPDLYPTYIGAARRHVRNRTLARVADNGNSCPTSPLFRPTFAVDEGSEWARLRCGRGFCARPGAAFHSNIGG